MIAVCELCSVPWRVLAVLEECVRDCWERNDGEW